MLSVFLVRSKERVGKGKTLGARERERREKESVGRRWKSKQRGEERRLASLSHGTNLPMRRVGSG